MRHVGYDVGIANTPTLLAQNKHIMICPSCGKSLTVDAKYLRTDLRFRARTIEYVLSCPSCRIRIRQYVYL